MEAAVDTRRGFHFGPRAEQSGLTLCPVWNPSSNTVVAYEQHGPQKTMSKWRIGLFLCMVIVGGILGHWVPPQGSWNTVNPRRRISRGRAAGVGSQLSADETWKLLAMKDAAIGRRKTAESVQVDGKAVAGTELAADGFSQLAAKLPKERLPVQNLAIARLLLLRDVKKRGRTPHPTLRPPTPARFRSRIGSGVLDCGGVELVPDATNPLGTADDGVEGGHMAEFATNWNRRTRCIGSLCLVVRTSPVDGTPTPMLWRHSAKRMPPIRQHLRAHGLADPTGSGERPDNCGKTAAARQTFVPVAAAVNKPGIDIDKFLSDAITAVQGGDWKTTAAEVVSFPTSSASGYRAERHHAGGCPSAGVCAVRFQPGVLPSQSTTRADLDCRPGCQVDGDRRSRRAGGSPGPGSI